MAIFRDLTAARNRDFRPTLELEYSGGAIPLKGARISIQVRLYAGAPGTPLCADPAAGFSDAPASADGDVRLLSVFPHIRKAALTSLPSGLNKPEPGQADQFTYEITLTYADGQQDTLWIGAFYLTSGVDLS